MGTPYIWVEPSLLIMPDVPLEQGRTRQLPQTALLKYRYEC